MLMGNWLLHILSVLQRLMRVAFGFVFIILAVTSEIICAIIITYMLDALEIYFKICLFINMCVCLCVTEPLTTPAPITSPLGTVQFTFTTATARPSVS